jgi:hypothetical protein
MKNAVKLSATVLCLLTPLSAFAVRATTVFDNGPVDTAASTSPLRPNGIFFSDNIVAATQFDSSLTTELSKVTFQAYQQLGSIWTDQEVEYKITLDDGGLPGASSIAGGEGSNVQVEELSRDDNDGNNYAISGADYELVTYAFDLAAVGVSTGTDYWLTLDLGATTGGNTPGATNLLWAYNDATSGSLASADGGTTWPLAGNGAGVFQIEGIPLPSTLLLVMGGFFGARAATRFRGPRGSSLCERTFS